MIWLDRLFLVIKELGCWSKGYLIVHDELEFVFQGFRLNGCAVDISSGCFPICIICHENWCVSVELLWNKINQRA